MKISIIIPIFGVEKYIAHCARSLFKQKGAQLEYIFVNDATQDSSVEILKDVIDNEYPKLKHNVKIVNKTINEGLPLARKTGVYLATGDYVMHCDSDDWLVDNAVEEITKVLEKTKSDVVYYNYYNSYENREECSSEVYHATPLSYIADILSFNPSSGAFCWNKVVKRSLYDMVHVWPIYNMHEDIALMPQVLCHAESIEFIELPLYHYRNSSTSSMSLDYLKSKEKRKQSKANQLIIIRYLERERLTKVLQLQYKQLIARCAYNAAFFDKESIVSEYSVYRSLWHEPLFWNFDVSIRRQLQSRIVILFYRFKNWIVSLR